MTNAAGTREHAARIATGKLIRQGMPRLAAAVGGEIASVGDTCWRTYGRLQQAIRRPDGKLYHRESVARACRDLRDAGIISSQRVFVGGLLPTKAKHKTSSRGTTIKGFNWRAIEEKNPFSRRQRRLARQQQAIALRQEGELQKPAAPTHPRHVSARAIVDPVHTPAPLDPELARMAEQIQRDQARAQARRQESAEAAARRPGHGTPERGGPPERPPPE